MSSSEDVYLRQVLRAHDASGERLAARLRVLAALVAVVVAQLGRASNTGVSNGVLSISTFLYLGYAFVWSSWFLRSRRYESWMSYFSVTVDLTFGYAIAVSCLVNHSGVYEVYRSPALWLSLAAANALTTLRGNPRVCWFSCVLTLLYGALLFVLVHTMGAVIWVAHASYHGPGLNAFEVFQAHLLVLAPAAIAATAAHRSTSLALETAKREQERERERVQLEWRLKVSDRMVTVGTMAAGVAHEMSNPLTYVIHNLEAASRRVERDGKLPELSLHLQRATSGTQRVHEIVAALRTFSRIEEGPKQPVDLRSTIDAALTMASSEVKHRARVEIEQLEPVMVLGNQAKLGQVFLNLVVNAAQAIPETDPRKHRIGITIQQDEGRAVVEVSDTGSGITPEHKARIFEPFFTTKPVGSGTGLGLSICQSIISELGGSIDVQSEVGVGSTFRVTLPCAERPLSRTSSVRPVSRVHEGRILVIENDALVSETLELMLAEEHEVILVQSAEQALERIERDPRFDAILCDLNMPGMSGVLLHRRLETSYPELAERMLFATQGSLPPSSRSFIQKMGSRVLTKPFRSEELRAKLRKQVVSSFPAAQPLVRQGSTNH